MDFVNKFTGGSKDGEDKKQEEQSSQKQESSGGGFMDKLHGMAGGGKESEKNEDALDKGSSIHSLLALTNHACFHCWPLLIGDV